MEYNKVDRCQEKDHAFESQRLQTPLIINRKLVESEIELIENRYVQRSSCEVLE